MKKTKIIIILLLGLVILFLLINSSTKKNATATIKEANKDIVDNLETNIEESLRAQKIYKNKYRLRDGAVSRLDNHYIVSFNVENITNNVIEHQHYDITLLSNTGQVLGTVECVIPELKSGESTKVETYSKNKKIFNAFDYSLSKVNPIKIDK